MKTHTASILALSACMAAGMVSAEMLKAQFKLEPTFTSCSVNYRPKDFERGSDRVASDELELEERKDPPKLTLSYRAKGAEEWLVAPAFPNFPQDGEWRGSVMDLAENTDYEVRILDGKNVVRTGAFRTWSSAVPVAKTIVLDPATYKTPFMISDKGTADGWIRYTMAPGGVLDNQRPLADFEIVGAEYVILEGLKLRGGLNRNAIFLKDAKNVRIVNCDISGWGFPKMRVDFNNLGHNVEDRTGGPVIDFHSAIAIKAGCRNVVVERCFVHDPLTRANSWFYSHPAGPEAVTVEYPDGGTVLRWNDFVGSDNHRYNDCVEGAGNFREWGGFQRDADVYGNYMAFANDDCIELDGGMCNVRCFGNRFEQAVCGVSIQGCMVSPVYVTDNLFTGLGEEHGLVLQTIKTSSFNDRGNNGSYALVADNTMWGRGTGIQINFEKMQRKDYRYPRYDIRSNVFCGAEQKLTGTQFSCAKKSVWTGNREGVEIAEKDLDPTYPKRPMSFVLDRVRFSGVKVSKGAATPQTLSFNAIHDGKGADVAFTVAKGSDMDWFSVTPAQGVLKKGARQAFAIAFDPAKMTDRRDWRGAFLVRGADGFSRPISLFARNVEYAPPFKPDVGPEGFALYDDFRSAPLALKKGMAEKVWKFSVPRKGRYWIFVHAWCDDDPDTQRGSYAKQHSFNLALDDAKAIASAHLLRDYPVWTNMGCQGLGRWVRYFDLEKGEHTLKLTHRTYDGTFDALAITDNPLAFEPR